MTNRNSCFPRVIAVVCVLAWAILAYSFRVSAQDTPAPQTATPVANPTPDDSITVKPDGTVTIPQPATAGGAYEKAFNGIVVVLVALIFAGGGYAIVRAFKTPEQAKVAVNTVLDIMKMAARMTPTPDDDSSIDTLQKTLNEYIDAEIARRVKEIAESAVAEALAKASAPPAEPLRTIRAYTVPGVGVVPPDEPL